MTKLSNRSGTKNDHAVVLILSLLLTAYCLLFVVVVVVVVFFFRVLYLSQGHITQHA